MKKHNPGTIQEPPDTTFLIPMKRNGPTEHQIRFREDLNKGLKKSASYKNKKTRLKTKEW